MGKRLSHSSSNDPKIMTSTCTFGNFLASSQSTQEAIRAIESISCPVWNDGRYEYQYMNENEVQKGILPNGQFSDGYKSSSVSS